MGGIPEPGQVVRVRSRQYLVEEVVPPPNPSDQHLVRLSCLDDDAQMDAATKADLGTSTGGTSPRERDLLGETCQAEYDSIA